MKKKICICGGGANGIVAALFFENKNFDVTLIEKSNSIGGILKSNKSDNYHLDQGYWMPNYTGIKDMDNFFDRIFPKNKFSKFLYKKKDIAGSIINNKFNPNSSFPDFKTYPKKIQKKIANKILKNNLNKDYLNNFKVNLDTFFNNRFGNVANNLVFKNISKKFWRLDSKKISSAALKVVHLGRINLFSEKKSLQLKKFPELDEVIAYPNQFKIPLGFIKDKTPSFYPKNYGLKNFLDHLLPIIKKKIKLKLNSEISKITINKKKINIHINKKKIRFDYVLWCGPNKDLFQLFSKKNINLFHKPIKHVTYYALVNKKINDGGIYWYWDYDINNPVIRVSFPNNYSSENNFNNKKILMFEVHEDKKIKNIESYLKKYLLKRKIIKRNNSFKLIPNSTFSRYFFVPSVENVKLENNIINFLKKKLPPNIFLCSAQISNFKFYFHDLIKMAYESFLKIKQDEI